MSSIHEYPVTVTWQGGRGGSGTVSADRSGTISPISVPPEFQGPGAGTNPEEMLSGSICACYSITLGIIAEMRKLPMASLETKAVGEVEQNGATFTFTKITLRPTITLTSDATDEHVKIAEEIAHKADSYCIITNAVRGNVTVEVEPTIVRGGSW
jgi:peroxiredoxin-like protein